MWWIYLLCKHKEGCSSLRFWLLSLFLSRHFFSTTYKVRNKSVLFQEHLPRFFYEIDETTMNIMVFHSLSFLSEPIPLDHRYYSNGYNDNSRRSKQKIRKAISEPNNALRGEHRARKFLWRFLSRDERKRERLFHSYRRHDSSLFHIHLLMAGRIEIKIKTDLNSVDTTA